MSNLIPEKRVNKRGVAVTKHVRATPATGTGKASMPAPALTHAKTPKRKALTKKQLEPQYHTLLRSQFATAPELRRALSALNGQPRMNDLDVFTCSEAEVYDVVSAVGLVNAGALLDGGLRTGADATKFLHSKGLGHLVADSSELTAAALNRGIPSSDVFYMHKKKFSESGDSLDVKLLLDSAEAHSHKGLRGMECKPPIHERVADGKISMDDLREIGPTRYLKAAGRGGAFMLNQLELIQAGKLDYDSHKIKETIIRNTNGKEQVDHVAVQAELFVARELGYEFASGLKNTRIVTMVVNSLEHEPELRLDAAIWTEALGNAITTKWNLTPANIVPLFKAGIEPERVADHLENGVANFAQIIAIESEGIAPSVSGGWL